MANIKDYQIRNGEEWNIIIPEGVSEIEYQFFMGTPAVSAVIGEGTAVIGEEAFAWSELKKVTLPGTLKVIERAAFFESMELKEVVIPDSVVEIQKDAFYGCKKLKAIISPNVAELGDRAFASTLTEHVTLANDKIKIGKNVFMSCRNLKTAGPIGGGFDVEFAWTEEIPANAFSNMKSLKKVVLPDSIKKIGNNAFKGCSNLTEVQLPPSAKVSKSAFAGCTKLIMSEERHVRNTKDQFVVVNGCLVAYNGQDKDVVIVDGVTDISRTAFAKSTGITSVTLPPSVVCVEQDAFANCYHLSSVTILGKLQKVGANAFFGILAPQALKQQVYTAVPIRAFTQAGWDAAMKYFSDHFAHFSETETVFCDNLSFMAQKLNFSEKYLLKNKELRHTILDKQLLSAQNAEQLLSQAINSSLQDVVLELLDYQNRCSTNTQKYARKESDLVLDMTPADWRKIFKLRNEGESYMVLGVKELKEELYFPPMIGNKRVRAIAKYAIDLPFGADNKSPRVVEIAEGIEEICEFAFCNLNDTDMYFPSTVTRLPDDVFVTTSGVKLHFKSELVSCGAIRMEPFLRKPTIYAPAGSYAEQYAKENNIPFVAE